jgi:RNA polymerase sigma-70 factor (ECF subfamily)
LQKGTTIANPATYLYRVAVNTTLDAVRRARRDSILVDGVVGEEESVVGEAMLVAATPEDDAITTDLLVHVRSCMAGLGDNRRRAVGLHLQGFTTREIGGLMGWTEAKARNLVYRGLHSLRERLKAEGIEYEGH